MNKKTKDSESPNADDTNSPELNKQYITVLIILAVLHITYIFNGFIWIDHNDIEQKFALLPLGQIYKAFVLPFGQTSFYRPLVVIVNSIDHAFYGNWAPGYHFTNLVLYFFSIFAFKKFAESYFNISKKIMPYLLFAFGVHPVGIFIAGNLGQRQESLLLGSVLLTLYYYKQYLEQKSLRAGLLAGAFWMISIFTKETALVIAPLLLLIFDHKISLRPVVSRFSAKNITDWIKDRLTISLLFGFFLVLYIYLRRIAVPTLWNIKYPGLTLEENIATRLGLLGNRIFDLISPIKPSFSDATTVLHISTQMVLLISFAVGGLAIWMLRSGKAKAYRTLLLTLAVTLLPTLNLIPVPRINSPHYSFLALPFFLLLIAKFIELQNNLLKKTILAILSIWLCIASYQTIKSGGQFKNDFTFFSTEVMKDKNFSEAYYYLGNYYLKKGDFENAAKNYSIGLQDKPGVITYKDTNSLTVNLATTYLSQGKLNEAENLLNNLLPKANESLKSYVLYNLALISQKRGDYEKIIMLLEERQWNFPEAYLLLAQAYRQTHLVNNEAETLEKALPLLPAAERAKFEGYINGSLNLPEDN